MTYILTAKNAEDLNIGRFYYNKNIWNYEYILKDEIHSLLKDIKFKINFCECITRDFRDFTEKDIEEYTDTIPDFIIKIKDINLPFLIFDCKEDYFKFKILL